MPQDDVVVKEEQFADEDFVKEHKPSYYAVKGIVIAAVAVCAIFFALAMFRGCSTSQAKDVEVPDYVGKSFVSKKKITRMISSLRLRVNMMSQRKWV